MCIEKDGRTIDDDGEENGNENHNQTPEDLFFFFESIVTFSLQDKETHVV